MRWSMGREVLIKYINNTIPDQDMNNKPYKHLFVKIINVKWNIIWVLEMKFGFLSFIFIELKRQIEYYKSLLLRKKMFKRRQSHQHSQPKPLPRRNYFKANIYDVQLENGGKKCKKVKYDVYRFIFLFFWCGLMFCCIRMDGNDNIVSEKNGEQRWSEYISRKTIATGIDSWLMPSNYTQRSNYFVSV